MHEYCLEIKQLVKEGKLTKSEATALLKKAAEEYFGSVVVYMK